MAACSWTWNERTINVQIIPNTFIFVSALSAWSVTSRRHSRKKSFIPNAFQSVFRQQQLQKLLINLRLKSFAALFGAFDALMRLCILLPNIFTEPNSRFEDWTCAFFLLSLSTKSHLRCRAEAQTEAKLPNSNTLYFQFSSSRINIYRVNILIRFGSYADGCACAWFGRRNALGLAIY